jgi:uncharacterized protein YegP (UPF0339 family)
MAESSSKRPNEVHVYQDSQGEYRWRLESPSGASIGKSEEGYVNESYAVEVAQERNPEAVLVNETTSREAPSEESASES